MIRKLGLSIIVWGLLAVGSIAFAGEAPKVVVYKNANCGCCAKWAQHLRDNGFEVEEKGMRSMAPIKKSYGVNPKLRSCHTAIVDGYVIEGHVPAKEILRLLAEKPKVKGLAVPGMPAGSPGMETPDGKTDKYDVLSFDADGGTEVYGRY